MSPPSPQRIAGRKLNSRSISGEQLKRFTRSEACRSERIKGVKSQPLIKNRETQCDAAITEIGIGESEEEIRGARPGRDIGLDPLPLAAKIIGRVGDADETAGYAAGAAGKSASTAGYTASASAG